MSDDTRSPQTRQPRIPWNKGKLTGPKPPLKVREIWAIRIRLQRAEQLRDLALFNLAIDSKLRGCDLVALRVRDVAHGRSAIVLQHKTQQPVQFELTDQTRESVAAWIAIAFCLDSVRLRARCRLPGRSGPHFRPRRGRHRRTERWRAIDRRRVQCRLLRLRTGA
jgi:site-specific recombinase XerC